MLKTRKKIFFAVLSIVFFIIAAAFSVSAMFSTQNNIAKGKHESLIENRVNFIVENNEVYFSKTTDNQRVNIAITLSAMKTEPDFFAAIENVKITGIDYNYIMWSPAEGYSSPNPNGVLLSEKNNISQNYKWILHIDFNLYDSKDIRPVMEIKYKSGIRSDLAQTYLLEVPIELTIIDKRLLITEIASAETAIGEGSYTIESVTALTAVVNSAKGLIPTEVATNDEEILAMINSLIIAKEGLMPKK